MYPLVRRGEITEISGRLSSGRTSLFVACLAEVTHAGGVVALVDVDGAFDPASAARTGVDLRRLLWIRCEGRRRAALRATDVLVRCPGFTLVALDVGDVSPPLSLSAAFRLKLALRRAGVALLILGGRRIAGASAGLAVETTPRAVEWHGPSPAPTRLARMGSRVSVTRSRGAAPALREAWWGA
ncbi:MAG: hypothetical protein ACREJG_00770 [Candidatus Rokuibacteriota bacterium]